MEGTDSAVRARSGAGVGEAAGGAQVAGVGWAAGVERLAMLVDEPAVCGSVIVLVAEHASRELEAIGLAKQLRAEAGERDVQIELLMTGNPRKRFDRAKRMQPAAIISLDVRDGVPTHGIQSFLTEDENVAFFGRLWQK